MQAYGWSLPANKPQGSGSVASTPTSEDSTSSSRIGANVPVPVPVYCRPLMEKEPGMKVSNSFLLSKQIGPKCLINCMYEYAIIMAYFCLRINFKEGFQ